MRLSHLVLVLGVFLEVSRDPSEALDNQYWLLQDQDYMLEHKASHVCEQAITQSGPQDQSLLIGEILTNTEDGHFNPNHDAG